MQEKHAMAVLAAAVANEFNDELTVLLNEICNSSQLLVADHPAHRSLRYAHRAALRCHQITRSLLEFSRRTPGPARPERLHTVLGLSPKQV
jgi:hypothetical protein